MTSQNTSHAVMAQRQRTPKDSLDYFPTPPWAARALCEHVLGLGDWEKPKTLTAWEPACGAGHLAYGLSPYFVHVLRSDVADYSNAPASKAVRLGGSQDWTDDFLLGFGQGRFPPIDWIITNPPFNLAADFVRRAIELKPRQGVAMLMRTQWLHSGKRFELFAKHPLASIHPFVERVPMVKGRLDRAASTATDYAWFIWLTASRLADMPQDWIGRHIPPCRKELERDEDYE